MAHHVRTLIRRLTAVFPGPWRLSARRLATVAAALAGVGCVIAGVVLALPSAPQPGAHPSPTAGRPARSVLPALGAALHDVKGTPLTSDSTRMSSTAPVAPLHGLKQADLLIVAPFSLPATVRDRVARLAGVTDAQPIEAAKVKVNGAYAAVLGVDSSSFRGYAVKPVASSDPLWQGVAGGGMAVSYDMGVLDRIKLGGTVAVNGVTAAQVPVVAFGTVGIPGVDAVVSDRVAESIGMPAGNAVVVSAKPSQVNELARRIKALVPHGAAVEQLVIWVSHPAGGHSGGGTANLVGRTLGTQVTGGSFLSQAQLTTLVQAALSRRGQPYVWGGDGPAAFDCSGLIQWSFAQAGLTMPRVAADQALTGPSVPLSQLSPGDLLFYRTDPTDPGYISHVAMYLGNGLMIQAPEPGRTVEVVPADFGTEYAGAVRVDPPLAAQLAGRPT